MSIELTEKEQTIKELTEADELTVAGIAEHLGVSPGSIYQSLKKLREAGELPPSTTKRGRPAGNSTPSEPSVEVPPVVNNGSLTVEAHVAEELQGVENRVTEITEQVSTLEAEKAGLALRAEVLTNASAVLADVKVPS